MPRRLVSQLCGLLRVVRDALYAAVFATLLAGLVGQLIGDRVGAFAPLMYIPLILVAPVAIAFDLLRRGRSLRGMRFSLTVIGLIGLAVTGPSVVGLRSADVAQQAAQRVRLLHWNVMWGGNWDTAYAWPKIEERIVSADADLIVLSEAPFGNARPRALQDRLGPDWHMAAIDHYAPHYVSRIRVYCRWPITVVRRGPLINGSMGVVEIGAPRPFRLGLIDGRSDTLDKRPFLASVADCLSADSSIDLACGDFNATSTSAGFRAIRAAGFRDAAAQGRALRPTWPAPLPLFDIDHILLRPGVNVIDNRSFGIVECDHRARVVDLALQTADSH